MSSNPRPSKPEPVKTPMIEGQFQVRAYSQKELADHYRCSQKTLKRWLSHYQSELGPRVGRYYNPRQVGIIVARLGEPG